MNTLRVITQQDIDPSAEVLGDRTHFYHREAARAVLTNASGAVALMHSLRDDCHKLPGGGIEEGEDVESALRREVLEETGFVCSITGSLGIIEEYRDHNELWQTSYCYAATTAGEASNPTLTEAEKQAGFEVVWIESTEKAIGIIEGELATSTDPGQRFMMLRDTTILKAVLKA